MKIREKLTYANVMATIAVFLVLGGGAYALSLGRNSVGTKQLKPGAVRLSDTSAGLHLKCPGRTLFHEGACIETASRSSDEYQDAFNDCLDEGRRWPTVAELQGARGRPGINLGVLGEWTSFWYNIVEGSTYQYARVVSENGQDSDLELTPGVKRAYRCVAPATG
jgi:hypothetical protein